MTTIMGRAPGQCFVGRWNKKTPRARRLGLGVRFTWCLSRLCTTSGPATQAGKGKPEVIKVGATHDRIMARGLGQRKGIAEPYFSVFLPTEADFSSCLGTVANALA